MIKLSYISVSEAEAIRNMVGPKIILPENRVLIFSPDQDEVVGSIIIPSDVKEGKPRKGVVISSGVLDEYHRSYKPITQTGIIVTYGLYAGKEVDLSDMLSRELPIKGKFTILDTNELIMAEINTKA